VSRISRYAHAKQCKRMRRDFKKIKGCLGRVCRDLNRQVAAMDIASGEKDQHIIAMFRCLLTQALRSKHKICDLDEPLVDDITKGKAHKHYEFGCKVSIATAAQEAFIVGARSYNGAECNMDRCYRSGTRGDALNAILSVLGKNLRRLLRRLYFVPRKVMKTLCGQLIIGLTAEITALLRAHPLGAAV
jgi:hypothetical protein